MHQFCLRSLLILLIAGLLPSCRHGPEDQTTPAVILTPGPTTAAAPHAPSGSAASIPRPEDREIYLPQASNNPATRQPAATVLPTALPPAVTPTPAYPIYNGPPLNRDNIGIQIYLHREDIPHLFDRLRALNAGWVKVQVSWKLHQPHPDDYSDELFGELDRLVHTAEANNIAVLLSVSKAPEWSRPTTEMDGPPGDYALYRHFMEVIATRYRGNVAAYELWNEPNLQREWNGTPLNATDLVSLIAMGAEGVRAGDPAAIVISAAPAVTGINDGIIAIDDRVYFRAMLAAGVAGIVDGFGVHPYGWANPPDSSASTPDPAVPTHNNHPSFFFRDTLTDYAAILNDFGVAGRQLWVTEFGWGSFDGFDAPPPAGAEFMANVSEWQQAVYTLRAYELAHDWPWVGPMMLWNLNFAPWLGPQFSESGYSLLRPDGTPRPAYLSLQTIKVE